MSDPARLVYFDRWPHPIALELLDARPHLSVRRLELAQPEAEIRAAMERAHIYHIHSTRAELPLQYYAHADLLSRCPQLLVVSTTGSGFDTVDLDACTAHGVIAVNQAGANREAVAEHTLGVILCLSKRIVEADRATRTVAKVNRNTLVGHDVLGRTLGIVGLGNVGARVAELARTLLRMRVLAYDPYLTAAQFAERGAEPVELGYLLASSDFVTMHCPLTDETEGMIGRAELEAMPSHAHFINTARGGIHDEAALADALREGGIAGAALDVWEEEPPPLDHPLLGFPQVIASPHIAGVTHEARRNLATGAVDQIDDIVAGRRPPRLLNPQAWDAYAERFERTFGRRPDAAR